jgi:hypothetical protein
VTDAETEEDGVLVGVVGYTDIFGAVTRSDWPSIALIPQRLVWWVICSQGRIITVNMWVVWWFSELRSFGMREAELNCVYCWMCIRCWWFYNKADSGLCLGVHWSNTSCMLLSTPDWPIHFACSCSAWISEQHLQRSAAYLVLSKI